MPGAAALRSAAGARGKLWGGKWKGQLQDWYLCRFLGDDSDVNIATKHPEFSDWKWVEPAELPDLIVPFKRDLYRRLLARVRASICTRCAAVWRSPGGDG